LKPSLKVIGPGVACLALMLLVVLLSVIQTAREVDRVDTEHSVASVKAAVALRATRLGAFAEDNAYWDDMAKAVYGPRLDTDVFDSSFAISTAQGVNYDAVYVLDPKGRLIYAIADGRATAQTPQMRFGDVAERLAADLGNSTTYLSTVAFDGETLSLIGISNIRPTDPALQGLVPPEGHARLIMTGRVTPAMLAEISHLLQLDNLGINGQQSNAEASITDYWGRPVSRLTWAQPHQGWVALQRSLPILSVTLLGSLIVMGLLWGQGLRTVMKLKRIAMTDALTRLPNRRALQAHLLEVLREDRTVGLAILNIDGFKRINDQFGHEVGDSVLRQSGAELARLQQRGFWIARLGGDEFALLVCGDDAEGRIQMAANRVLAFVKRPLQVEDRSLAVAASLGLALGHRGDDPVELMRRADVALHAAKAEGKHRANWFDSGLDERRAIRHEIEADLRKAIDRSELGLVYQPLYKSDGSTLAGVEALLRWHSETRGDVSPEIFVPIAEESGLIVKVGLFALRQACTDARRWPDLKVAVNVSAAQLRAPGFTDSVARILAETAMPPDRLELEITETYIIGDPDQAQRVLGALRALGVTLVLDDFGTGYASIGFLRHYRFGKIKIDRSLIADIEHSESSRAILQASVTIARALDMYVTAEGVETDAQATLLRVVGCDHLQGWHFDSAMSADQIDVRLAETLASARRKA
jgi:diguanylate cyclase (GGDEF) domain